MSVPFPLALLIGALSGFIALGYEIAWARIYNFVSGSNAQAFGMLLGSYLLGLALGSLWSRRWQDRGAGKSGPGQLARLLVLANLAAFFVIPIVARMVGRVEWPQSLPVVIAGSALLGATFPLLCHLSIPPDHRSGARLSYLYLANIIGSGLGSLLTGLVLTEYFPLWQIAAGLLVLAVLIGMVITVWAGANTKTDVGLWAVALGAAVCTPLIFSHLYERLLYKGEYDRKPPFVDIVEGRHGVITVDSRHAVYGNGAYDGELNLDPFTGGGLFRPFFLSAIHPAPREVLVIGVASGAWTKILAHNPAIEQITAVEISEDYLRLIRRHSEVADLLTDPKVTLVIDDGRRWLRRNPDRRFDAILMNTTINWREFASALIGREFLEVVRSRLKPGGVTMWNCTSSERAFKTGLTVFPYTMTLANFCCASQSPLVIDYARWRRTMAVYRIDGHPVFDLGTAPGRSGLDQMQAMYRLPGMILNRAEMEQAYGGARIITDDNLGHEYKFTLKDWDRIKNLLLLSRPRPLL